MVGDVHPPLFDCLLYYRAIIYVFFFGYNKYKMEEPKDTAASKTGPKPKELVEATYTGLPVGRDKKVIDPKLVEKLAALGCTDRDIADFVGIKEDTLRYNFADNLLKARAEVRITLRRAMLDNACKNMNAAVQIFLAKNMLGMQDTPTNSEDQKPLPWDSVE